MSRESIVPEFRPPGDIMRGGGEGERDFTSHHAEYNPRDYKNGWVNRDIVGNLDLRLMAFIVIAIVVIIIVVWILEDVVDQHRVYNIEVGGPTPELLIIGTSIAFLIASIVIYYSYIKSTHSMLIFWLYIGYIITYLLWIFNLGVRIDLHDENMRHDGNGFMFIFSSTLFLLGIIYVTNGNLLLFIPLLWNLFLIYHWIFS